MTVFDFFKKLFGWANQQSLKRKADDDDISIEREFITPKKVCYDYQQPHHPKTFINLDEDSDSDGIEVIDDHAFYAARSCSRINGARNCRNKIYAPNPLFSPNKSSSTRGCLKESTMGYVSHKTRGVPDLDTEWCPTLTKTHHDREKHQYAQMLQNFISPRINVIRKNEQKQKQRSAEPEVIKLDDSDPIVAPYKLQQVSRKFNALPHLQWRGPKEEKHKSTEKDKSNYLTPSTSNKVEVYKSSTDAKKSEMARQVARITTNTLRDTFSARTVVKTEFIPEVAKKYHERDEQRYKEIEDLKKMTDLLSKRNRWTRDLALEEQLARSMKLCEAILDEKEEPPLPSLTEEMMREVNGALIPRPPDEVLVDGFGLRITRKDMNTLAGLNWLNDEVINYYMNLLIARGGTEEKYPKVYAMNTFFYPKLLSGGHSSLKRWTRKVDIFAQDLVVIPVHLGIHWCMSVIDFRDKTIRYYDSMGGSNNKCLSALRQYLEDESMDKKKQKYDTNEWKLENPVDIPQQMNGSDCGVFSCVFAEHICANRKINFTQDDMPYFRNKMVYEILKSKLL